MRRSKLGEWGSVGGNLSCRSVWEGVWEGFVAEKYGCSLRTEGVVTAREIWQEVR